MIASSSPRRQPPGRIPSALLIGLGAGACTCGFFLNRMDLAFDGARCADALLLLATASLVAWIFHALRAGTIASALCVLWLLGLIIFAGIWSFVAVLLMALAALAIGEYLVPPDTPNRYALAFPVGMVLIAATLGWLTPLPIHHRDVYVPLLLGVIAWRGRALQASIGAMWHSMQSTIAASPACAAVAMLAIGLALTGAWLPTMQSDDLSYHLALPSRLLSDGYYAPDPAQQIWALAPWLADLVQAMAQVISGHEARGDINALWLLSASASLYALAGVLGAGASTRWLAVACLSSLPTIGALCAGMQTELPAMALLFALVLATVGPPKRVPARACAVLTGGLIALKFGQAVSALVVLVFIFWRQRNCLTWRCGTPLALFLGTAGSSYFYAAKTSGNPMLPLFNQIFRSPVMAPQQLFDPRWHAGFGFDLPWAMTFSTDRYLEATPGGFGFVLVALSGAWILALLLPRTRAVALIATLVLLLPLMAIQYARYALPGMALLLAPMFAAGEWAWGARRFGWLALAICILDLAFQANAGWSMTTVQRKRLVSNFGNPAVVLRLFAPERLLIAQLREKDPSDSIVLALNPETPYVAELGMRGRNTAWYAPALEKERMQADQDPSGERWQHLIENAHARWLLLRPENLNVARRQGIALSGAKPFSSIGVAELWWVDRGMPVSSSTP